MRLYIMIPMSDKEFDSLSNYIKLYYGINLTTKKVLVEGRLSSRAKKMGFNNFTSYLEYVFSKSKNDEIKNLVSALTTNHTYFMREPKHFVYFKESLLPQLVSSVKQKDLRIWSAGCSTGEEPYTLAMIIDEFFGNNKLDWDTKILATDISVRVLELAKQGRYSAEQMEAVPENWRLNYFNQINNNLFEINEKIKDEVIFRIFNLMDDFYPFKKKFHVIFCRNVMIYFDYETKLRLIKKFYECLEPGGYLFIGHSESINKNETDFKYILPSTYQKSNM